MVTTHTKRIGIVTLVFFLASVTALFVLIVVIEQTSVRIHEKEIEQSRNDRFASELSALQRLVRETEEERAEVASYILPSEDVIDFIELIEALGVEQGTELNIQSLSASPLGGEFEKLDLVISVSGSYESVTYILKLLETLPYQSSISQMQLRAAGGNQGTSNWTGSFTLRVTKFKES